MSFTFHSSVETCYRSAASRAYYFIFHLVKNYLEVSPPDKVSHLNLINLLKESGQKSGNINEKRAAVFMENCKRIREMADYRLDKNFFSNNAKTAIDFAHQVQKLLS